MTRLLLVRHGQSEWNALGRVQGQQDVALSTLGMAQAEAVAAALATEKAVAVFSSDLQRAVATAAPIASQQRVDVQPTPLLRELAFGLWEGMRWADVRTEYAEFMALWAKDVTANTPPAAETVESLALRGETLLQQWRRDYPEETVIVVTHGGMIRTLLCLALELPLKALQSFGCDNASITELYLFPEGSFLAQLNNTAHLH